MAQPRKRFTIEVTEADIEEAKIGDSYRCVLAHAIARQVPNAKRIEVDLQTVRWTDEQGRRVFLTPYVAAGYIVAFDAGEELHPFSVRLGNPVEAMQRKAKTRAAREIKQKDSKVQRERARQRKAETVLADPKASEDDKTEAAARAATAPKKIKEAEADLKDARALYRTLGQALAPQRVSEATRTAPPKVIKTKKREYGNRVLRVNQEPGRKHYA
jgi:hypothetical protein